MEVKIGGDAAAVIRPYVRAGAVLGLATGRTQHGIYAALRGLDWSGVTTFNLDEFVGATTFRDEMREHLFGHVTTRASHFPEPANPDAYENAIRLAGGIDLQLLGIGENGHIGYNEPTSSLASRTRQTVLRNGKRVVTMGVATILEARHILMVAYGRAKAKAVAAMIEGPLTAMVPASALQMHPRVTVVLDEDAASLLTLRSYYDLQRE